MKSFFSYLATATFIFFTPLFVIIAAIGAAIILNTLFGLYRTIKFNGWNSVTASKLGSVAAKMFVYELGIILLYIMDFCLFSEFFLKHFSVEFLATKIGALILIFVEGISIKENFEKVAGRNLPAIIKSVVRYVMDLKKSVTK